MTDKAAEPIYLLAIDNGTQSVRALIFDQFGNEIAKARVPIEPYFSSQPSFAEQHADYYWQKLSEACQQLWQSCTITPNQIAGVSLATQRYTMICLDKDKQPLRPAIVWMDLRRAETNNIGLLSPLTKVTGMGELVQEASKKPAVIGWPNMSLRFGQRLPTMSIYPPTLPISLPMNLSIPQVIA